MRLGRIWTDAALSPGERAVGAALAPLGAAYGLGVRARRAAYRAGLLASARGAAKVVCVGNLTVGGSGKTPVAIHLARTLREAGVKVAYVSRGYGRGGGGLGVASDGERAFEGGAERWGDEPLLAARKLPGVPVLVAARRAEAVAEAARRFGAEACVLDDGLQHLALRKDFAILMVDGVRGLGNGRLLPAGPLRDLPAAARADVSAVIVKGAGPEADLPAGLEAYSNVPRAGVLYRPTGFVSRSGAVSPEAARGKRAWLVAGVADPGPFQALCEELGLLVEGTTWFGDHHRYTRAELDAAQRRASKADWVVTTEKDWVRLGDAPSGGTPWLALAIEAELRPAGLIERLVLESLR